MEKKPTVSDLRSRLAWPFGDDFLGARHFLARIQMRPFATLETEGGVYRFFARVDKARPQDIWLEVTFNPVGVKSFSLPVIYKRLDDDMDRSLEAIHRHIESFQRKDDEWEDADIEEYEEEEEEGW